MPNFYRPHDISIHVLQPFPWIPLIFALFQANCVPPNWKLHNHITTILTIFLPISGSISLFPSKQQKEDGSPTWTIVCQVPVHRIQARFEESTRKHSSCQSWRIWKQGWCRMHGSYKWIIMHEKCGRPDSNGFQLKWRLGTQAMAIEKNLTLGGRFGSTS